MTVAVPSARADPVRTGRHSGRRSSPVSARTTAGGVTETGLRSSRGAPRLHPDAPARHPRRAGQPGSGFRQRTRSRSHAAGLPGHGRTARPQGPDPPV